jgi:Amt family ammonium transporter
MAERTDFKGKINYSILLGLFNYPVVVHWVWQGEGWLTNIGFLDLAGSTVVHQVGGIVALIGAAIVGPRVGREFGNAPKPSNMMLATLGTFILWFGWYGFNVGSTLGAGDPNIMGLVAVNTTLAAAIGAIASMMFVYFRTGKWDLGIILNGSLAGLVGITAGCAFVSPIGALFIGATAGVVVVLAIDAVEAAKIDDAVGAFAVHGACGALGTLAIGFWGVAGLTGGNAGLFLGGGFAQLVAQATGVIAVTIWTGATSIVMFMALKAIGVLRMPAAADAMGIDAYEHDASLYGDILPVPDISPEPAGD